MTKRHDLVILEGDVGDRVREGHVVLKANEYATSKIEMKELT